MLKTLAGTGFSKEDIHVLNQVTDSYHNHKEVPIESSLDAFNRLVKIQTSKGKITINAGGKTIEVPTPNAVYPIPKWYLAQYYSVEDGVFTSELFLKVWGEGDIGVLKMKYGWDEEMYKVKSVEFKSES